MAFTASCIQLTSTDDVSENIAVIEPLLREAAAQGARLISLPENAFYMRREGTYAASACDLHDHPGVRMVQQFARAKKLHVVIGSIRVPATADRYFNRCVVVNAAGDIAAQYDKIHLFDVTLPSGQSFKESAQFDAGDHAIVTALDGCGMQGLSICYDVRFAALYRTLAQRGAEVLHIPSAFTQPTGQAHWHILTRARAIECSAYVMAAAQCGEHPGGRTTYGHSLIIDPWGTILSEATRDVPCVISAQIDLQNVHTIRHKLPSLQHTRSFN